jgi:hypothetical protein
MLQRWSALKANAVISRVGLSVLVVAVPDLQRNALWKCCTFRIQVWLRRIQMCAEQTRGAVHLATRGIQNERLASSPLEQCLSRLPRF